MRVRARPVTSVWGHRIVRKGCTETLVRTLVGVGVARRAAGRCCCGAQRLLGRRKSGLSRTVAASLRPASAGSAVVVHVCDRGTSDRDQLLEGVSTVGAVQGYRDAGVAEVLRDVIEQGPGLAGQQVGRELVELGLL